MKIKGLPALAGVLGLSALLAGCSNDPYYTNPILTGYGMLFGGGSGPTPVTQQQIVQTLSATDLPVAFLNVEDRDSQTLVIRIEQNPPYATYATSQRQGFIMRNGMLVGTRGLGGDLLSTDEEALLELVRARRAGTVTYIQRFVTPEDVTEVITYRCEVEPDKPVEVAMGFVQGPGTEMVAACQSADGPHFVDYFVVDSAGEIMASRQWLGAQLGYVAMHMLRR